MATDGGNETPMRFCARSPRRRPHLSRRSAAGLGGKSGKRPSDPVQDGLQERKGRADRLGVNWGSTSVVESL